MKKYVLKTHFIFYYILKLNKYKFDKNSYNLLYIL
jgi:hypothetical protein